MITKREEKKRLLRRFAPRNDTGGRLLRFARNDTGGMSDLRGFLAMASVVLIFMLAFTVVAPPGAHAAIPRYINYQGKLTDSSDNPVTGDVSITIRIYDAETGGTALWTETQTVTVTRGIFSMLLGNTTALTSLDFNSEYWYSVEVESDGQMTPRQRLTAVGYAMNSDRLGGYTASQFLRADADTSLTGALTVSGNITGSANGDITLDPTGTGNIVMKIDSTSGDFKITDGTTNWVKVSNAGAVTIAKDLTVSGTIYGTLASTGGDSTFSSIVVTGTSDLRGNISNSGSGGAVTIADALTQSGSSNQVTFGGNVDANNGLDVTGALTVSGATTLSSVLNANSNVAVVYSGSSAALSVTQSSTGPAAQFSGQRVIVGASETSNAYALSTGELYVLGDLEVDGTLYANVSSSGATSLGSTTLSSLTVTGTSDLQGNISNSAGTLTIADNLSVTKTDSSTSGTVTIAAIQPTFQDGGTNSTTTAVAMNIAPTINYTGGTKTGSYTALKIAATETSLPTGSNYLIDAYGGSSGTTQVFYVDNSGNAKIFGTLNMNSQKITGLAEPTAATDAATKNYADAIVPASAGGWTDAGTGVYLLTSTDNVGIGTTSTGTYKLNVSGSINTTSFYIGGTQVTATATELSRLAGISANVTAANLGTLTGASNADSLHTHTATGITSGVVLTAPSSAQTIQPSADVVPLTIKGKASATSNVLSIYDAAATPSEKIYVDSAGHMYIAETTTGAAQNSAATMYFGRNSTDNWEIMGYDPALGTKGKFTFSAPLQVEASSPTGITFIEKDQNGTISKSQDFTYDPSADQFSFSGGVFAQQFKNLVKNSSFEAFSAFETFHDLDPRYATGNFDPTMGGMRNTTAGYEGGWNNFEPDEWTWVGGDVFQNAPMSYTSGYNVAATTFTQDYTQGVSAVRIKDTLIGTGANNTGTGKDGELKQTISGLEPGKVYSVGIDMRVDPNTLTATKGIVDIVNELDVTGLILNGDVTPSTTTITITQEIAGSIARLPSNGFLWIEPDTSDAEQVSYTGKSANSVSGVTRGINGTTARNHNSGAAISCAFKQLEATTTNASTFSTFKGQFITDEMATSVEIHLIARSTDTGQAAGTVLFDSVQVVAGKSVPEYQTGTITDSGDQTIYGALRIGRASDEKGGILSVDKFVRTRGIEFFTDDPGFTGQKGGFAGFGGINPPVGPYNSAGSIGTLSLFTSGDYTGSTQTMSFYVQITNAGSPNQFKWYYDDGTGAGYVAGNNDAAINVSTNDITLGTTGVKVRFNAATGGVSGDRWDFFATRIDPVGGYNSYGTTTTYTPSGTRIFKDPDPWSTTYNQLIFEDGTNRVSISSLISLAGTPSQIDPAWAEWNQGTANSGGLSVNTSGNYTGTQEKFYKVQVVTTGTVGSSSGTFKWSDNGGSTWSAAISMSFAEQAVGSEGVRVKFLENPMANDPTGRLSDAYITGGVIGDTWGFGVHPATGTASVKTNPTSTQTILATGASATNVTPLAIQMVGGQAADPFVIKDSVGTLKFRVDTSGNVIANSISGTVDVASLPVADANTAGIIPSTGLTDAMVSANANISQSKLNLAISDAQVAAGAGIAQSKLNLAISDAQVAQDAGIAWSKISKVGAVASDVGAIAVESDPLALKTLDADNVKDTHIDWGTGANQVSTTDMPEGANLYYTDTRVDSRLDTDQTISGNWTFSNNVTVPQTPVSATDAASKAYVDAGIAGLKWKQSVRAATTATGTLATSFANTQVIDGVTLATGDRVLIKNQATGSENGIYTVNASGAPTRATDADTAGEMKQAAVFIEEGTNNADTAWVCNNDIITLGTTALTFTQFTGAAAYTWGNGLTATGTTIDVGAGDGISVDANNVIATLGTAIDTTEITDGTIANLDISDTAAIATSKLSGAVTSITGHGLGDLATLSAVSGGNAGTITDDSIINADIKSDAAIATSKLSGAVTSINNHGLGSLATLSAVSGGVGGTITDDSIVNADIKSDAGILTSKLSGAVTSISGHGLGNLATLNTVGTTEITDGAITTSDINASAGILDSQLATSPTTRFYENFAEYVETGLQPAASANLTSNISAGTAYVRGARINNASATSKTYTASKDTYVDIDSSGNFQYTEVANDAGAPAVAANSIRLAKVVTDGTAITTVTDMRSLYPVTANEIAPGAVTSTGIQDGSIGTAKLADSAVTSIKIADEAIVNGDIASNAAIAQSKLNLSITNTEVADGAGISWSKISKSGSAPSDVGAAASSHTHSATDLSGVVFTAPALAQTIQPTADVVSLTIKGQASATSNVLSIYDAGAVPAEKIYVDSAGHMRIAETTTGAAQASSATLYFGRNATDNWETIGYDPTLGETTPNKGKFTFSAPIQVEASSPTGITFVEKNAQGQIIKSQGLTYDPSVDEFSFTGGTLKQAFQNLIRNPSFETSHPMGWQSLTGAGTYTISGTVFKFGNKSVIVKDTSATDNQGLIAPISDYDPDWKRLQSKTITLSLWAKADSTVTTSVGFDSTGSESNTSASEIVPEQVNDISLTSNWQNFKVSYDVPASAAKLKLILYGAQYSSTGSNTYSQNIYFDGLTLVEGKLALDYGPSPIFDTGSQVIYGSLAVGANYDPNQAGNYYEAPRLIFGQPDSYFGGGYGEWTGGSGEIRFMKWDQNTAGTFMFNRGVWLRDDYGTSYGATLRIGSSINPLYATYRGDIYAAGRLELGGQNAGAASLLVGAIVQGQANTSPTNATTANDAYVRGKIEADGGFYGDGSNLTGISAGNVSGIAAITGISGTDFAINADATAPEGDLTLTFNRGPAGDAVLKWNETSGRFEFNNPLNITTGGLNVAGTITAGTGSNVITTAAGLLDATKLSGTMPATSLPSDGYGTTYVNTIGDTMTGDLTINQNSATANDTYFNIQHNSSNVFSVDKEGDVYVGGDLQVQGDQVILNVQTIEIESNNLLLNRNVTGSPVLNAMVSVERGDSPNTSLRWNETSDVWDLTNDGVNYYTILHSNTSFVGDVSGIASNLQVTNDSHSHTSATLPASTSFLGSTIGTSEIEDSSITSAKIADATIAVDDIGLGAVAKAKILELRPYATTPTANNKVNVAAGIISVANNAKINFAGAISPAFDPVTADSRIDLLTIDSTGALVIIPGTQAVTPVPPTYPTDKLAIAEVTITETAVQGVSITNSDILDVRPFLNLGSSSGDSSITTTDSIVFTIARDTDEATNNITLAFGNASGGQKSIIYQGASSDDFVFNDDISLGANSLKFTNNSLTDTKVGNYDSHLLNTSNPHSVTAAQIGGTGIVSEINAAGTSGTINATRLASEVLTQSEGDTRYLTPVKALLTAEYSNAIMYGDGSFNIGTMAIKNTADANWRNYYEWSSQNTLLQDYTISIRYELPQDFSVWALTNAIKLGYVTETASNANNKVDITIYKAGSASAIASSIANYSTSWSEIIIDDSSLGAWSAGDILIIEIKLYSKNSNFTRVGDITLNYIR